MPVNNKTTSSKAAGSMKDAGRSGRNVSVNRNSGSVKRLYTTSPKSSEKGKEDKQNKWKSGSAAGSMKDAKRSGRDVSVNRNYGSTKALYSSRAKEKEEEEKKNSGSAAQKNTASYSGRNDSRETRESQQHSYDGSSEVRQDKAPATSSVKSMYNSDWMSRPEDSSRYTFESHSDKKDEDKVDVGQLAFGVVDQAYNQFVGDAIGTADFFFGTPYQKLMDYGEEKFGWEDRGENFISAYNKQFQENARKEAEYYAQNASKSEIASLINQFGPTVLALLPEVALAYLSKGSSLAANGMKAAGKTASIVNKASKLDNITDVMKNASLWGGTASTIGQTYNQAKYEGADTDEAMKYALTNGMLNFGLNTLGLMHGQAGVETLPGQLRELATPRQYLEAYGKAALHDGGEAMAQGALQRGARAIYDDNVELVSADNPNAVLNPRAAMMDFGGGTAASLVTAGMHAGTKALDKPANAAAARLERAYFADEMSKGESPIDYADALRSAELLGRLTKGEMISKKDIEKMNMNNKTVREIFTRETGVPISSFDIKDKDILRQKLNITAAKTKHGDTIDRYPLERLGYSMYTNVTGKPRSHNYKHGDWTKNVILEDSTHFKREGRYKKLRPNVSYVGGDQTPYIYQTDHLARPKNVTGVLILAPEKMSEYRYGNTPEKIKGYDDAGHIVGRRFKGSGKLDNLLSQCAEINRGEYKKLEDSWEAALKDGKELYVDFDIVYPGDSKRPEYYDITYYINGKYNKTRIHNPKKQ